MNKNHEMPLKKTNISHKININLLIGNKGEILWILEK